MNAHTQTALVSELFLAYAALLPLAMRPTVRSAPRRADPAADDELALDVTVEDDTDAIEVDVSDFVSGRWRVVPAGRALLAEPPSDEGQVAGR